MARLWRYMLSTQQDDLEQSILGFTEAIYPPLPSDTHTPCLNIVQIFYYLTLTILFCAGKSRQPEDVKCCIMYLRYLRGQWHEVPNNFPLPATAILVCALALQVELELGDADQDIEEMADLCGELLNSDVSIAGPMMAIAGVINARLREPFQGQIPSEKVVSCLQKAIIHLPDMHGVSIALSKSLYYRFHTTHSDDDYKEGIAILDRVISFRDSEDRPSPYLEKAAALAARFSMAQFSAYGKPEDLEQVIYHIRTLLDGTSLEGPARTVIIGLLSGLRGFDFNDPNVKANVQGVLSGASESTQYQVLSTIAHFLSP